ncbi:UNKNOWN [Stylonychia lemnae]|uniref:Chromo domain-containing protein n=1 Tax=Stylonychia lemnae TaxID=5949 RepID=A0A077ZY49_STYLE|nr:UNKNOWN [Stylonychia lemnae]|eukprot:CDW74805.1 UNKNOWN [Stylonychia lemnae]
MDSIPNGNGDELYEVEKILTKAVQNGQEYYEVKWKGYNETSWEPIENLQTVNGPSNDYQNQSTSSYLSVKEQLLRKRNQESSSLNNQIKQNSTTENSTNNFNSALNNSSNSLFQEKRKRLKKSRDSKFRENAALPHDLQTESQILHSLPQLKKQKTSENSSSISDQRLNKDASIVAQHAHDPHNNTIIDTFSNQSHGVIIPSSNSTTSNGINQMTNIDLGNLPKNGTFETDMPLQILKAQYQCGRLFLTVQWQKRPNGVQPEETIYTNSEIKKQNPLLLCEFYEKVCKVKKRTESAIQSADSFMNNNSTGIQHERITIS